MSYLDIALPLVAEFEGFRAYRYIDAVGVPTIGYGETRPDIVRKGYISEPAARRLLRVRLAEFGGGVDRATSVSLSPHQHAALTSFAYNVGLGGYQGSTLRRRLNARQYASVPSELMRWTRGGGRVLAGLVRRRKAEAALWSKGVESVNQLIFLTPEEQTHVNRYYWHKGQKGSTHRRWERWHWRWIGQRRLLLYALGRRDWKRHNRGTRHLILYRVRKGWPKASIVEKGGKP